MSKEHSSLADRAYDLLEQKIIQLELAPGETYSEAELSETIELGRTPMREALLRLAKERLVEMIPRRGVRISSIDLTNHIALLETRKALDVLITTRAARRASPEQKERLRECSEKMLHAGRNGDIDEYSTVDNEIDVLIGETSNNEFAVEAVAHLYVHCRRFWAYYHDHLNIGQSAEQHSDLVLAVADGDEKGAEAAVIDIIDHQISFTRSALDL